MKEKLKNKNVITIKTDFLIGNSFVKIGKSEGIFHWEQGP